MKEKKEIEPPKPNKVFTSVSIDPEVKEKAEKKAKDDGRSLSNYIERLIIKDLLYISVI